MLDTLNYNFCANIKVKTIDISTRTAFRVCGCYTFYSFEENKATVSTQQFGKRQFAYLAVLFSWRGCPEMIYSSSISNNVIVFSFRIGVPVCPLSVCPTDNLQKSSTFVEQGQVFFGVSKEHKLVELVL